MDGKFLRSVLRRRSIGLDPTPSLLMWRHLLGRMRGGKEGALHSKGLYFFQQATWGMKEKKAATDAPVGRSLAEARRPTRPTMTFLDSAMAWERAVNWRRRCFARVIELLLRCLPLACHFLGARFCTHYCYIKRISALCAYCKSWLDVCFSAYHAMDWPAVSSHTM